MKKAILLAAALGLTSPIASAIATNYVLRLNPEASVQCGPAPHIEGLTSYTLQLWFNADSWTPGATLIQLAPGCELQLGDSGQLLFKSADASVTVAHSDLTPGKWVHLTLISDNGAGSAFVNGNGVTVSAMPALPAQGSGLRLGGGFSGRIDEVRVWKAALKQAQFDHFRNNTVNRWNPQVADLAAYYKMDQNGCENIVDYTDLWDATRRQTNNHGVIVGQATRELNDNPLMKYRLNGAYTANERFFDRVVPADNYLLSNDLIILGIESFSDGHLEYFTPNNHAVSTQDVSHLAEYAGRNGVASFDGSGCLTFDTRTFNPAGNNYAFEAFIYIDEWIDGAELYSKRSADGTKGLRLRLGAADTQQLVMECDGHHYTLQKKLAAGKWIHVAVQPNASGTTNRYTYNFFIDGASALASPTASSADVNNTPTMGDYELTVGRNFKGKMDNVAFWHSAPLSAGICTRHMNQGLDMPGIGKMIETGYIRAAVLGLEFDTADNLGFDSYSQDNWLRMIHSAYAGHSGYEVRISVKSHEGWETTINDAGRRKIFAQDLARLSQGYDGVELDLEWEYGTQTRLGLLADEIRAALPADKSFMISEHNVAYGFPTGKMAKVDGFTFQQYGPQKNHFGFNTFVSYCNAFVNYGYPKDKIITSYSTTTSVGHANGQADFARPIKGVKDGFLSNYTPDFTVDSECRGIEGYNYYFTSPAQTYRRARHTVEQGFGGIFYWDMGNDLPASHEFCTARWASYGLNSNVEPAVTRVDVNHSTGLGETAFDHSAPTVSLRIDGSLLTAVSDAAVSSVAVTDLGGRLVTRSGGASAALDGVAPGVYIASVTTDRGVISVKFTK